MKATVVRKDMNRVELKTKSPLVSSTTSVRLTRGTFDLTLQVYNKTSDPGSGARLINERESKKISMVGPGMGQWLQVDQEVDVEELAA